MKKIIYILLLILPFIYSPLSADDARIERWNIRKDRIAKYRDEVSKIPGYGPETLELFNGEIRSAEEFLSVMGRYRAGDGSVKSETRKYTVEEIGAFTTELAGPVISVYYASELVRALNNTPAKDSLKDGINRFAAAKGLPPLKRESGESESLAKGYILQRYMSGYEASKQKALGDISAAVVYDLSRRGYNTNEINLRETVLHEAGKRAATDLNSDSGFNESFLTHLPEWREIEENSAAADKRLNAAVRFAESRGVSIKDEDRIKGIMHIEKIAFLAERSFIISMSENTEKSPSSGYNNPMYEIPDFKGIITAVEEIDKYRKALLNSLNGLEQPGFMERVKNNNRGLSDRFLKPYDNLYKRERLRISKIRERNSSTIIYNEEIFNVSEKHFEELKLRLGAYADMSSSFIEELYKSWRTGPEIYLEQYRDKTEKNLLSASFIEKLTSEAAPAGKHGGAAVNAAYRGSLNQLFTIMKQLYNPEPVPAWIRGGMTKENLKAHGEINRNLRLRGTALSVSARNNYEAFSSSHADSVRAAKESSLASESGIGQDEVDRLFSCAKRYSDAAVSLKYTESALRNYAAEYSRITDDIRDGNDLSPYLEKINSGSIIPLVDNFSPEKIDGEMKLRNILAREGNESLSGAIALVQHYARRGIRINIIPTPEEIKAIRDKLSSNSEVTVSTWRMNGKNYRLVDTNGAENLKKMINRKAWHPGETGSLTKEKETFTPDGKIRFALSLPAGWKRSEIRDDSGAALSVYFQSPDLLGGITIRAVKFDNENIQIFSDDWNRAGGFTPVAKEWGKRDGRDYLVTVSKNGRDRIMESYIMLKEGYIILISGTVDRKKQSSMNRNLKEIFSSLEI